MTIILSRLSSHTEASRHVATRPEYGGAIYGSMLGVAVGQVRSIDIARRIAGGAGSGVSAGAIFGLSADPKDSLAGAVAGAATGILSGGVTAGLASLLPRPVGWFVLGVSPSSSSSATCTFDCWKPVLHDLSSEPSCGMLLKDVVADPRIKRVTTTFATDSRCPEITLCNVWDELFRIEYVMLPWYDIATHAVQVE